MPRRRPRNEDGQAAVELALAFPLAAVFLLGAVQVTVVIRDQLAVIHAAREAARAAAVSTDAGDGVGAGQRAVELPAVEITVSAAGGQVRATATRTVRTDVPFVGLFLPDVTVRGTAVMALEP